MFAFDGSWQLHEMSILIALGMMALIALVRATMRAEPGPQRPGPSPEQILERRYARGEIGRATYLTMRRDLRPR
jgi:hypothetical protein